MNRKTIGLCVMLLVCLLGCFAARAEETTEMARDITMTCIVNNRPLQLSPEDFRDHSYNSFYTGSAMTIQAPAGETIGGILLKWRTIRPAGVIVKTQEGGNWKEVLRSGPNYAAQFLPIPGLKEVRITTQDGSKLEICEIEVITPGNLPRSMQVWRDPPEKVDMMVLSTHPDDEVLWFGGLLPTYAGERQKDVLVVTAVYGWWFRRLELLDALWTCGVDIYPVLLGYPDEAASVQSVLEAWSMRKNPPKTAVPSVIRQYRPDVLVMQDVHGEYGHPAHIAYTQLGCQAVTDAASPLLKNAYDPWEVPKVYIHLYPQNQLRMDWNQPLDRFDGKTALEVAAEGFACHLSQQGKWYRVVDGGAYDNALYGLYRTTVGQDEQKDDLFEHIDLLSDATPTDQ